MLKARSSRSLLTGLALAAAASWLAPPAAAAEPITHEPLTCVPLGRQNVRVMATLSLPSAVASVRAYFRYIDRDNVPVSYIELRHGEGGEFWGVLPKAEDSTKLVEYRVAAVDADGKEYTTETRKVNVTRDCKVSLTDQEKRYANNIVVGTSKDDLPARPEGFLCDGIISKITPDGVLLPAEPCPQPGVIALGAGAVGALVGTTIITGAGDKKPVSPSRPVPPNHK
jgi:hypothetical protein